MPEADWGLKHTCQECGAKYYDMGRSPIDCPLCGALLVEKPILARSASLPSNDLPPAPKKKEKESEEEVNQEEDTADILPDDDVLPEIEDEPDSEEQEDELSSVLDDKKAGSET